MFYSQYDQDKYLENNVFKGHKKGVFVDIGAHNGIKLNNTMYFEMENDWTGVNVEANVDVFTDLVKNRPNSININCAICNTEGEAKFISNSGYTTMLSGLQEHFDKRHRKRLDNENASKGGKTTIVTVKTRRLESVFDEHHITRVNYLSVDVEGAEYDVLKSINYNKVFIDVIGFENNYEDTSKPIIDFLKSKDYVMLKKGSDIFMIHSKSDFYTKK